MRSASRQRLSQLLLLLPLAAFFGLFLIWPLLESLRGAFVDQDGHFTLAFMVAVFENPVYLLGFRNAIAVALGTTLLSALVGVPLALLFARWEFPGRRALAALVPLPLFVPPFVGALGIQRLLGPEGAFNAALSALGLLSRSRSIDWLREGRFFAVVCLTALHLYPVLYFNLSASLASQNPELEQAAESLGARWFSKLWRVTIPLSAPSLFASLTIVFIWALTELGVPLLCDYDRVTSVQIFVGLKDIGQNPLVYALVAVTLLVTSALYALSRWLLRRPDLSAGLKGAGKRERRAARGALRWLLPGFALLVLSAAALPNLAVILLSTSFDWYGSVLPSSFTLSHYRSALGHELVVSSIAQSLRYVACSTTLDLVFGFSIAWLLTRGTLRARKLLDSLAMLPLAVPGLVLAFGYLAISRPGRPLGALDPVRDPTLLLIIAYAMRRLPFVLRSAEAGLLQLSRNVEDAAQSLGAPPARVLWRVTLPQVLPHLLAGGLFAFALSMLEVSDSLILAQKRQYFPITRAIYELSLLVGEGRLLAAALGVWAMLLLATTVWVARRLSGNAGQGLSDV